MKTIRLFLARLKEAFSVGLLPSYWGAVPPPVSSCIIRPEIQKLIDLAKTDSWELVTMGVSFFQEKNNYSSPRLSADRITIGNESIDLTYAESRLVIELIDSIRLKEINRRHELAINNLRTFLLNSKN